MTKQIPKTNSSSTKKELLEALEVAREIVAEKQEGKFDPIVEAKKISNASSIQTAENAIGSDKQDDVQDVFSSLKEKVTNILNETLQLQTSAVGEYEEIKKAIDVKQGELKDLYDIEVKANTLAALIEANNNKKDQAEKEFNELKAQYNSTLSELQDKIKETQKQFIELEKIARDELKTKMERLEEEFEYEFSRKKLQMNDSLKDELDKQRKELELEKEKLDKLAAELEQREEIQTALEERVESIPSLIEEEVKKAVEEAKKSFETSKGFEIRAIKSTNEANERILHKEIELLKTTLEEEKAAHKSTQDKLSTAYGSVEAVAKASVEGKRTEDAVNRILNTMGESGKK